MKKNLLFVFCVLSLPLFCGTQKKIHAFKPVHHFDRNPNEYVIDSITALYLVDGEVVTHAEFITFVQSRTVQEKKVYNPKEAIAMFGEKGRGGALTAESIIMGDSISVTDSVNVVSNE